MNKCRVSKKKERKESSDRNFSIVKSRYRKSLNCALKRSEYFRLLIFRCEPATTGTFDTWYNVSYLVFLFFRLDLAYFGEIWQTVLQDDSFWISGISFLWNRNQLPSTLNKTRNIFIIYYTRASERIEDGQFAQSMCHQTLHV